METVKESHRELQRVKEREKEFERVINLER